MADVELLQAEIERLRAERDALAAALEAAQQRIACLPADWREDSSLETWFPFTAEQLAALQAENERLREEVAEWKRVAAAQAELHGEAEDRADKLAEALREVMLWIENWSPPFTEDDEWPDTEAKAQAALHPTAAQENNDA